MAGLTTTGLGLPTASAVTGTSTTDAQQPGLLVQGAGGSTTLPAASASDFTGTNPTPLDQPHPSYPGMTQSHVAVLQAIGTPEAVIAQLNASQPQAEYLDRYIQGEIMQNPEGWDAYVGNPAGTARAGLQQLMPDVQLPAPGAGNAGYLPDGSPVSGIQVPGLSTPLLDPTTGAPQAAGGGGLVTGLMATAGAVGIGLLGWKFLKNRNAGNDAAKAAAQAFAGPASGGAGAAAGMSAFHDLGAMFAGAGGDAGERAMLQRGISLNLLGGGARLPGGGGAATAATAESIMNGFGSANGFVQSVGSSAVQFNLTVERAAELALQDRWMGVLEQLAKNGGTLADVAAAGVVSSQALRNGAGATGAASAQHLAGLQQMFAGAANALA